MAKEDFCNWEPYIGNGDNSHHDEDSAYTQVTTIVFAIVNLIEGSLLSIYLIMHSCRRTKLNRLSWFGTIAICVLNFVTGIALILVKEPDC